MATNTVPLTRSTASKSSPPSTFATVDIATSAGTGTGSVVDTGVSCQSLQAMLDAGLNTAKRSDGQPIKHYRPERMWSRRGEAGLRTVTFVYPLHSQDKAPDNRCVEEMAAFDFSQVTCSCADPLSCFRDACGEAMTMVNEADVNWKGEDTPVSHQLFEPTGKHWHASTLECIHDPLHPETGPKVLFISHEGPVHETVDTDPFSEDNRWGELDAE